MSRPSLSLRVPTASLDFFGQPEWDETPTAPIEDVYDYVNNTLAGWSFDNVNCLDPNKYNVYRFYVDRSEIPAEVWQIKNIFLNLKFFGVSLGQNPACALWLYTDIPFAFGRSLGFKRLNFNSGGFVVDGGVMFPDVDATPEEYSKLALITQSVAGAGDSHSPPFEP